MYNSDTEPLKEFTRVVMAGWNRESGRLVVIDSEDLNPRDTEWSTTFYVVDPRCRVFEVSIWDESDPETLRQVMAEAGGNEPLAELATEPEVLAQYGGMIVDSSTHITSSYVGVVFISMLKLATWAHVFQMEDRVNTVGTSSLRERVAVNIRVR